MKCLYIAESAIGGKQIRCELPCYHREEWHHATYPNGNTISWIATGPITIIGNKIVPV